MAQSRNQLSPCQKFLDAVITNLWVGPMVVIFWTCTWNLLDLLISYDSETLIWIYAAIGFGSHFMASCLQGILLKISIGSFISSNDLVKCFSFCNDKQPDIIAISFITNYKDVHLNIENDLKMKENNDGEMRQENEFTQNCVQKMRSENGSAQNGHKKIRSENGSTQNGHQKIRSENGSTQNVHHKIRSENGFTQNGDHKESPKDFYSGSVGKNNEVGDPSHGRDGVEMYTCNKRRLFVLQVWNFLMTRSFCYVMAVCSVCQWKAIWHGWDYYTSISTHNSIATFLVSFSLMFVFRCSSQTLGPPIAIRLDVDKLQHFSASTYFGTKVGTWRHILDSLFSVIFVPFLNVTTYRGLRYFQDLVLLPNDRVWSAFTSTLIVYSMQIVLISTREYWIQLSAWSCGKSTLLRYFIEGVYTFLNGSVAITFWRGVWILFEEGQFVNGHLFFMTGHIVTFGLMMITFICRSCVPTGCSIDCSLPNGENLDYDNHYFSKIQARSSQKPKVHTSSFNKHIGITTGAASA